MLHLVIPFLPPTSNRIYVNRRGGHGRFLSKEAEQFKKRFSLEVVPHYLPQISQLSAGELYRVGYVFYFPKDELINKGFAQGKAQSRYKRMDVENRLKLISDSLSTALGVDDSLFFGTACDKRNCELVGGDPQVHIFLTTATPTEFGL